MHEHNHISVSVDIQGYLINFKDWNEKLAIRLAELEGITLHIIHWEVIYFVRMFYKEYKMFPKIRTLINIIAFKYGPEKGNSRYLIQLFPKKSVEQQIAKISGLPKPKNCM